MSDNRIPHNHNNMAQAAITVLDEALNQDRIVFLFRFGIALTGEGEVLSICPFCNHAYREDVQGMCSQVCVDNSADYAAFKRGELSESEFYERGAQRWAKENGWIDE